MLRWTEPLSESGQSSLARIDSQTERMSRLVEDLLTLARLDEGREPKLEQVDLTELVLECTSDMQAAARTHEWHLNLPDEPVEVVADRSQIQRVILNLLSNARKHTDEGTRVTAGLSVDAARREAVVTVTDNGPGIAPEFLPKIFDRFTRADKARSGSDGPPAWAWRCAGNRAGARRFDSGAEPAGPYGLYSASAAGCASSVGCLVRCLISRLAC